MQNWGSFFDQAPTTEGALPVAAMRAAVRPTGGPFGAGSVFPKMAPVGPSVALQSPPIPRMEMAQAPEMKIDTTERNDISDLGKGIAGIIDPESQKEKKPDGFNERMSAIDAQLQAMAEERKKLAAATAAATGAGGPNAATAKPTYGGTGAGSNAAGPEGFNYNVGNIRTSNIGWQGKGQPHNGFETFSTPQAGAAAMFNNLASYASSNPAMTVAGAVAKWAPPSENNTQGYIAHVAKTAGIDPNTPLATVLSDPDTAAKVMRAMAIMEKGQGLHPAFTHDLFRTVAGGKPPDAPTNVPVQNKAKGGRVRYLRSLLGA